MSNVDSGLGNDYYDNHQSHSIPPKVPRIIFTNDCQSCLQSHDRELKEALKEAVEIIKIFHGEPAWEIYYNCSPEMKRIRAILERNGDLK